MKKELTIVIALAIAVYVNILGNGFTIDDSTFIGRWQGNRTINLVQIFRGDVPAGHEGVYRPIRQLLYGIYYQLWADDPVGYHVHAIVVHIISTIFVYLIIEQIFNLQFTIFNSRMGAFIGAALFAVHPVHTEAVSYTVAGMDTTGLGVVLAAFYYFLRKKFNISYALAAVAFFTTEMALTLPILLVWYELCFGRLTKKNWETRIKIHAPFWISLAIYVVVRFGFLGISGVRAEPAGGSAYVAFLTMLKVNVKYLELLVYPVKLANNQLLSGGIESFIYRGYNRDLLAGQRLWNWDILLALGVLIGIIVVAYFLRKKHPAITFGIGWHFIALLPVMQFIPQGAVLNERSLYLPSFGFILIVGYLLWHVYRRARVVAVAALVLVIGLYVIRTVYRNADWKNDIVFWSKEVAVYPNSAYGYYSLGNALRVEQKPQEALAALIKASQINPRFAVAVATEGLVYEGLGNVGAAIAAYEKTLTIDPAFYEAAGRLKELYGEKDVPIQ